MFSLLICINISPKVATEAGWHPAGCEFEPPPPPIAMLAMRHGPLEHGPGFEGFFAAGRN